MQLVKQTLNVNTPLNKKYRKLVKIFLLEHKINFYKL